MQITGQIIEIHVLYDSIATINRTKTHNATENNDLMFDFISNLGTQFTIKFLEIKICV